MANIFSFSKILYSRDCALYILQTLTCNLFFSARLVVSMISVASRASYRLCLVQILHEITYGLQNDQDYRFENVIILLYRNIEDKCYRFGERRASYLAIILILSSATTYFKAREATIWKPRSLPTPHFKYGTNGTLRPAQYQMLNSCISGVVLFYLFIPMPVSEASRGNDHQTLTVLEGVLRFKIDSQRMLKQQCSSFQTYTYLKTWLWINETLYPPYHLTILPDTSALVKNTAQIRENAHRLWKLTKAQHPKLQSFQHPQTNQRQYWYE